jgi:hypothetical protein
MIIFFKAASCNPFRRISSPASPEGLPTSKFPTFNENGSAAPDKGIPAEL